MMTVKGFPLAYQGGDYVPPLTLVLDTEPPPATPRIDLASYGRLYHEQAVRFLDVLQRHAPGGFVDAIFAELAHRKASVFGVACPAPKVPTECGG